MRFSRVTWFTTGVVGVSVALALALKGRSEEQRSALTSDAARAVVGTMRPAAIALAGEERVGGFLRAVADITLSAERAGRVVGFAVPEGGAVRAGKVLVHLDDTLAAARREQASAAYREAALDPNLPAAELARAQELWRAAEYELRLHHPVSPLDGVLDLHRVEPGEYVSPGSPLADVVDASRVLLDVDVSPEAVGALHLSDAVDVGVDALASASAGARRGRISRIAGRADPSTRRFRVEVEMANADGILRPGMHAEARFLLPPGPPAMYLPKSAVRIHLGETGVFMVIDRRARWHPVATEQVRSRPDLWRIVGSDLPEGAEVLVSGFSGVRDGTAVDIGR